MILHKIPKGGVMVPERFKLKIFLAGEWGRPLMVSQHRKTGEWSESIRGRLIEWVSDQPLNQY